MHEITITRSRYLTEDAVATAVAAVAESVIASGRPVSVEFPIVPRSIPADWGALTFIRVLLKPDSAVSIIPSSALGFRPASVETLRIYSEPDPRFGHGRDAVFDQDGDGDLDDLGYDIL